MPGRALALGMTLPGHRDQHPSVDPVRGPRATMYSHPPPRELEAVALAEKGGAGGVLTFVLLRPGRREQTGVRGN